MSNEPTKVVESEVTDDATDSDSTLSYSPEPAEEPEQAAEEPEQAADLEVDNDLSVTPTSAGQPAVVEADEEGRETEEGDEEAAAALVPDEEPADERTFDDLNLEPAIMQALDEMGYENPMPVQIAVYDHMMAGHHVMVQSRTGSGKTAGFGIPIAQKLDSKIGGAQALILAPTRELALQVSRELSRIVLHKGLVVVPIYGGAPMKPQIDALRAGAQIVAGTPGRVLDHLRRGTLKGDAIRTLVLDECDEMLSMGFQEEIENIIAFLPPREERQTVLFSATIPDEIQRIARRHMTEPVEISLSTDGVGVEEIDHYYYVVSGMARTRDLLKVIKIESPDSAIIFCNTREDTNHVARFLRSNGYDAEAISSDLTQRDRERVMKRMRDGNLHFLVATDVAARGIDISNLSHVINYAFPESPEVYVHRTGRTGRAGKSGVAVSLVGPRELSSFYYLKLIYRIRPTERDLPTADEMSVILEGERYRDVLGKVDEEPTGEYRSLARRVWQSSEGERIVAYLLQKLMTGATKERAAAVAERAGNGAHEEHRREEREEREPREERRVREEREPREERRVREGRDERRAAREEREPREERSVREEREPREGRRVREEREPREGRRVREEREGRRVREEREPREERSAAREEREPREERSAAREEREPREERSSREERRAAREERRAAREERRAAREERRPREDREEGEAARGNGHRQAERAEAGREDDTLRRRRRPGDEPGAAEAVSREPRRKPVEPEPEPNDVGSAYAPDDPDSKEFWETWADEVSTQRATRAAAEPEPALKDKDKDEDEVERSSSRTGTHSARLYVNLGKREELSASQIREILGEGLGKDAKRIGSIALRNTHCYVLVPEDLADKVIDLAAGRIYNDRELVIERARR